MRIRTKFLCFLLVVVITPLCALGFYAWWQTDHLGRQLADNAATALEANAAKELLQTADMLGENCSDTLDLLETSLSLTAGEAARLLLEKNQPPVTQRPLLASDFDAGAVPASEMSTVPGTDVAASYDEMAFHLAPGLFREQARPEIEALSRMRPFYRTLFARHKHLMLFGYVGLASGLHCAYPGHGGYPPDYDPRRRPWYQNAIGTKSITWDIMSKAQVLL